MLKQWFNRVVVFFLPDKMTTSITPCDDEKTATRKYSKTNLLNWDLATVTDPEEVHKGIQRGGGGRQGVQTPMKKSQKI